LAQNRERERERTISFEHCEETSLKHSWSSSVVQLFYLTHTLNSYTVFGKELLSFSGKNTSFVNKFYLKKKLFTFNTFCMFVY
jgi:hypothetical protein